MRGAADMNVLLFLANGFETMEASVFVDIMGWAGIKVTTCAMRKNITSTFGVSVNADILISDVCIDDYDALAIPGGFEEYGFYEDAFSEQAVRLIKEFNDRGKLIATICVAALALGNSGILNGKRATTYHLNNGRRQKQLAEYGAIVVNEPVVRTENIITYYNNIWSYKSMTSQPWFTRTCYLSYNESSDWTNVHHLGTTRPYMRQLSMLSL